MNRLDSIYLPANTNRKNGQHDRRFATQARLFFVYENGQHVAEVEAASARGAIGRLAVHLGIPVPESYNRFTAEEA